MLKCNNLTGTLNDIWDAFKKVNLNIFNLNVFLFLGFSIYQKIMSVLNTVFRKNWRSSESIVSISKNQKSNQK